MDSYCLPLHRPRKVTECGANLYVNPSLHPDRVQDVHDLLLIQEGEWNLREGEHNYLVRQGDVMLLRAGLRHFSPVKCPAGTRTRFIHFTTERGDRDGESTDEACAQLRLLTPCAQAPYILELFREMESLFWSERADRVRQMALVLDVLLGELAYIGACTQPDAEWMTRLIRVMREEPTRMLTLGDAAKIAGMSVRSLSTHFKALTGRSVYQYQLNFKLEQAYAAIQENRSRSIADVADSFGFCDAYQFSRLFRRKYGAPPSSFRRSTPVRRDGSIHESIDGKGAAR